MIKKLITCIILILFFLPSICIGAGPALPIRIGGAVTINNVILTNETDTGFTFKVTRLDGTELSPPAEDKDGLSKTGIYTIDIPVYDPNNIKGYY